MTSQASSPSRVDVPFPKLPWFLASAFLLLYLFTAGRGAGLQGILLTSKVTGWDWQPFLQFPLYFLVTLPVRLLPVAAQPGALNLLSAVLGAGAIGLVARSVQLLPQDRTKDQRERERNPWGLLSGPAAWLPATTAALMCGLQLLFWQNATNASSDMLNLFVLAWIIRELLEYRVDGRERRLTLMAFLYGLGVTSSAALIALFPFMLGALVWVMGRSFFRSPLILKLFVAGVAGLLLYLLLPSLAVASAKLDLTFWESLRENLRAQKAELQRGTQQRLFPLVMCLGSLFPLVLIGVRWPSSFGDASAAAGVVRQFMFRILTLLFIAGSLAMNFHLQHAAKAQAETGLSFHSLYLISALVIGYSLGYLLVVFGKKPGKSWQQPGPLGLLVNRVMVALAWLLLPLVAVGLFRQNFAKVRDLNHSPLYDYASRVAASLPEAPALVLADDYILLSLVTDQLNRLGRRDHWLLHTRSLGFPAYHRQLNRMTGGAWPQVPDPYVVEGKVADPYIIKMVADVATNRSLIYLHPSFGYYFEWFYPEEDGFLYRLNRFTNAAVEVPAPGGRFLSDHEQFLQSWWTESIAPLAGKLESGRGSIADAFLAQLQSKVFNEWGCRLQQASRFEEAAPWFERASQLFTNNVCSLINLEYNRHRRAGGTNRFQLSDDGLSVWKLYREDIQLALNMGGSIDEPGFCVGLGNLFASTGLQRQAAQQFLRALALTPDNQFARAQLARTFLQAQAPDRALAVVEEIRQRSGAEGLNQYARIDLAGIEAMAWLSKGDKDKAIGLLADLGRKYPEEPAVFELASQIYLGSAVTHSEFLSLAEDAIQRHLQLSPSSVAARNNLGTVAMLKQDWTAADAHFSEVLAKEPEMDVTRLNRAIANLRGGQLARAQEDYLQLEKKLPDDPKIQYGLAEIADRQGRTAEALRHFNAYLERAPKAHPEYTNVLNRVAQLKGR